MLLGIYEQGELALKFQSNENEKAGEFLLSKFSEILQNFEISSVIYANTPGSFMGIKLAYVILKTFSVAKNFELFAVNGFELNGGEPIRANKNLSFVFENGEILLKKAESGEFLLPQNLNNIKKSNDILPKYIISAV